MIKNLVGNVIVIILKFFLVLCMLVLELDFVFSIVFLFIRKIRISIWVII